MLLQAELTRCQQLGDELAADSLYGTGLLEQICHLRQACARFTADDDACADALEQFGQASDACFRRCAAVYAALYQRVYDAVGDGPRLRAQSVPVDPACALNVVEPHPQILLYNDNETLYKFAPSALPCDEAALLELEAFYAQETQAMAAYYAQHRALLARAGRLILVGLQAALAATRVSEALATLVADEPPGAAAEALSTALDALVARIEHGYVRRRTQAANCAQQRDNASAKFNECARLKDQMLRPHYLTRAHAWSDRVAPLF